MNGHVNHGMENAPNPITASRGQMDVNMLYQKLIELSELLKDNREKTKGIVSDAEKLAAQKPATTETNGQNDTDTSAATRMAELTRRNAELTGLKDTLLQEQYENSKLLGEYENAIGDMLEKVRGASFERETERARMCHELNNLLQDEKDAHLQTRLERDEWHSRFLESVQMLREAYRLNSEEEEDPVRIVAGLQNQVRGYRLALGLPEEPVEEESGYQLLK